MSSLVIVALPAEDDYVNKISSEKVPHMTLLFLGEDVSKVKNLNKIMDFVGHAADQSLMRFGLEVDHRGEFGPDQADVLFFSKSKWSGFEAVNQFRSYLLQDSNIRTAYDSATQFPEFVPHLTLGYPATPANPDERDYPGISYVSFDRIAVWFSDFEGVEFPLKAYQWDEVAMGNVNETVDDILKHHGVKGMHWGVRGGTTTGRQAVTVKANKFGGKRLRTAGGGGHPAHPDALRARTHVQVGRKSGLKALSNKQLEEYNKRLNLEQNASRLSANERSIGKRFVMKLLGQSSTKISEAASQEATQQVKTHVFSKVIKTAAVAAA